MPEGHIVEFAVNGGTASGYLARPTEGSGAGVVVVQEYWGLVPHIKDVAGRFAALGYVALAPDLYHGQSTVDAEEAQHLMEGLDWGRAARELGAAGQYLRTEQRVSRLGIVGFCMGGALAVVAASQNPVDAYAAFYGFPPAGAADVDAITAPGLFVFGEHENYFSVADCQAFAARQTERGRDTEVVVYPGAGHAFFNDTRTEVFRRDAAEDAWERTVDLFTRHLQD